MWTPLQLADKLSISAGQPASARANQMDIKSHDHD